MRAWWVIASIAFGCVRNEGVQDARSPDSGSFDALRIDAESDDASGRDVDDLDALAPDTGDAATDVDDAEPADALPSDATLEDGGATPDSGSQDVGPVDSGTELRIETLTTSNCTAVLDVASSVQQYGTVLGSTHVISARDSYSQSFLRPDLTNPQPILGRLIEVFSDLRTGIVYTLGYNGFQVAGYQSFVNQIIEVTETGTTARITPLSETFVLPNESLRFSGLGFAIIHAYDFPDGPGHLYRIDLPGGLVTDLGLMHPFGARSLCNGSGIAENFGGSLYLVAPEAAIETISVIKRHRVPDGATSIVADLGNLGYACSLAVDPWLGRWYFEWDGPSVLGGTMRSVAHCSASFQPGGDGIVVFPGIRKEPIHGDTYSNLGLTTAPGALAGSFIAPAQNTRPIALGTWIRNSETPDRPNMSFQIWGSTPNGDPDVNQILATSQSFIAANANVFTYFEMPVFAGATPLTPGSKYWFVATTYELPQSPNFGRDDFARHTQNSDGLIDDGAVMYSYDQLGIDFNPNPGGSWAEVAFSVTLGP